MTLVLFPGLAAVPAAATYPAIKTEMMFDGATWTDVTPYVDTSGGGQIQVSRGSTRVESPVIRYDAGTCQIPLTNIDRRFDPANLDGPYVSGAGASTLQWLADANNIHSMYASDPATTKQFFNNSRGFLMGSNPAVNPVQDGLAANPVLNYKSYAKLQADIAAGAITGGFHWLLYDPENWATTSTAPLFGCSVAFPAGMTSDVGLMKACKIFNAGVPASWPGPGGPVPAGVTTPLVVIRITLTGSTPWISSGDQTALAAFFRSMPLTGTPIVSINQEGEANRFGYSAAQVAGSHNTAFNIFKANAPSNAVYCQDLQTFSASAGGRGAAFPNYICCAANGQQDLPLYLLDWYPTSNATGAVASISPAVAFILGVVPSANIGVAECNYNTDIQPAGITYSGGQLTWFTDAWAYAQSNNFFCFITYFLNAHGVMYPPDGGQPVIDELALINTQSGQGATPNPTPLAERNDPWTAMTNFCTLAHAHGFQVILTPGRDLGNVTTSVRPKNPGETLDQWYIRTGIATTAAAVGDVFEVQDQSNTLNPAEFTSFFGAAYNQAKASNAATPVWCGLSTNFGTPSQMFAAAVSVPQAQGFWVNMIGDIPDSLAFFRKAVALSAGTPRVTQIRPMVPVRVSATYLSVTYRLFTGSADAWLLTYSPPSDAEVAVTCTDGFKILAIQARQAQKTFLGGGEDAGARIRRILTDCGWSAVARNINNGYATLQPTLLGATPVAGVAPATSAAGGAGTQNVQNAVSTSAPLDELQLTAETEMGELYINGNGFVVFRNRNALFTDTRSSTSQAVFGDDPAVPTTELPYANVNLLYDEDTLWNGAAIANQGSAVKTAFDPVSQQGWPNGYGPHVYDSENLLADSDWQSLGYAQFIVVSSSQPELRFTDMTVDPRAQPADLFPQVLQREIGDRITITRRPPGGGTANSRDVFIRGITHAITDATWSTTWVLEDTSNLPTPFIADSPVYGVADVSTVGF